MKSNFHTHCNFCDGLDSPEELVITAIEKGFYHLGFSSHNHSDLESDFALKPINAIIYRNTIADLKEKYKNQIDIYCGIEQDYFSDESTAEYDYVIGSVHYVLKNGEFICVDNKPEIITDAVNRMYGGDFDAFAEDYFSLVADVVNKTNADIIGHIDLISKFSNCLKFTESERYLKAAENAVKTLVKFEKPFEINTGGMSRGYKDTPYPSLEILKMIKKYGGKIIITSDCHNKDFLDYGFNEARELAIKAGFTKQAFFENGYFKFINL